MKKSEESKHKYFSKKKPYKPTHAEIFGLMRNSMGPIPISKEDRENCIDYFTEEEYYDYEE